MSRRINLTTTMTSKGQITVPVWIIRRLRMKPGAELLVTVDDDDTFRAVRARRKEAEHRRRGGDG